MFDFHTHILPEIDDGSRNVTESLIMVRELKKQGVSGIAATPHFYANWIAPDRFFAERQAAWEKLAPDLPSDAPEIRLGAEVQYFEGIHRFDGLDAFCLEGTELLLLEMPMGMWTARMVSSIVEINSRAGITVMLAHIERYLRYRNQEAMDRLLQHGVLMQASTDFFAEKRRMAMRMLLAGEIHFLGTDCHNMTSRKPNFSAAVEVISREKGEKWRIDLERREAVVLHETKNSMDNLRHTRAADWSAAIYESANPAGGTDD